MLEVLQMMEGGWWEGASNESTGWFPSNYVVAIDKGGHSGYASLSSQSSFDSILKFLLMTE